MLRLCRRVLSEAQPRESAGSSGAPPVEVPSTRAFGLRSGAGKEILVTEETPKNFFDGRTIAAVVLIGSTFLGWQFYMQKKYPEAFKKKAAVQSQGGQVEKPASATSEAAVKVGDAVKTSPSAPAMNTAPMKEEIIRYDSETMTFELSSLGMGLKNVVLKKYTDRSGSPVELGHPEPNALALETRLLGRPDPLNFKIQQINPNFFVGRANVGAVEITKSMEIDPKTYLVRYKVSTTGTDDRFVGVTTFLTEEVDTPKKENFLLPQFAKQEFFVDSGEARERVVFQNHDLQKSWSKVRLASVGSQYFTQAIVDQSPIMPEVKANLDFNRKHADLTLFYPVLNRGSEFKLEYLAFIGPKSQDLLSGVDGSLVRVIDFGFFDWIGRQILVMLRWFFALVGNWGWAIILLTLLVRLMVLPFNLYSYKSMKAMQAIQPQIQSLRERYKDDQQAQQQEMMRLMRDHKVNPLGGCLPVFLQFPIFIALYQVLGNSIELYQAPFMLWIHDLSLKDPYYILPVLMGVTMFIQQKITPNTMDPAQAKVLLMMPLIFTFFMVTLPSGLTLYMWVGAVFSVLQQLYFMREKKVAA